MKVILNSQYYHQNAYESKIISPQKTKTLLDNLMNTTTANNKNVSGILHTELYQNL